MLKQVQQNKRGNRRIKYGDDKKMGGKEIKTQN